MRFLKQLVSGILIVGLIFILMQVCLSYCILPQTSGKEYRIGNVTLQYDAARCDIMRFLFSLRNVRIKGDRHNKHFNIHIDEIHLDGDWRSIVRGMLTVHSLIIRGMTIDILWHIKPKQGQRGEEKQDHTLTNTDSTGESCSNVSTRSEQSNPAGYYAYPLHCIVETVVFEHNSIRLTNTFPDGSPDITTLFLFDGEIDNLRLPRQIIGYPAELRVRTKIQLGEEAEGRAHVLIDSLYPAVNATFALYVESVQLPHFNPYFRRARFEMPTGQGEAYARGICVENQLQAELYGTFRQSTLASYTSEGMAPGPDFFLLALSDASRSAIINMINAVAQNELSMSFPLNADITNPSQLFKELLKNAFLDALRRRIFKRAIGEGGLIESFAHTLTDLTAQTPTKLLEKKEKMDVAIQENIEKGRRFLTGVVKGMLTEERQ